MLRRRVPSHARSRRDHDRQGSGSLTSVPSTREEPEDAFDRLVTEGQDRLTRPLLNTAFGVLIYLVVKAETGNGLLATGAFTIGFVALLLARSELLPRTFGAGNRRGRPEGNRVQPANEHIPVGR